MLTQPFAEALAEAEKIIAERAARQLRARPGRRARLPGGQRPGVAADGLGLPARLPVLRPVHRAVHEAGARQPGHPVLPRLPARRRGVRGDRQPRHHRRPELPGAQGRLHPRRGARQPERVRRPGDRRGGQRRVRVPPWPRQGGPRLLHARPRLGDARRARGVQRLGRRAPRHAPHPPRGPGRPRAAAGGGHRHRGETLRGGRQAPAVAAADLPRLPRVVLPERAGQHADPAARHARRACHPVLVGGPLRSRRRRGHDRDRARRGQGGRAVPGHPARQHVVHLARLRQPPDQPHRRSGEDRRGRPDALRDQRARPRGGELAGADRAQPGLCAAAVAAADPRPRARKTVPKCRSSRCANSRHRLPFYDSARVSPENGGRASPRARPRSRKGCSANAAAGQGSRGGRRRPWPRPLHRAGQRAGRGGRGARRAHRRPARRRGQGGHRAWAARPRRPRRPDGRRGGGTAGAGRARRVRPGGRAGVQRARDAAHQGTPRRSPWTRSARASTRT